MTILNKLGYFLPLQKLQLWSAWSIYCKTTSPRHWWYLAQILLGFASEYLSQIPPVPRLRLGGFTLKWLQKCVNLDSYTILWYKENSMFNWPKVPCGPLEIHLNISQIYKCKDRSTRQPKTILRPVIVRTKRFNDSQKADTTSKQVLHQ